MARITLQGLAHSYAPHPSGEADYALKPIDLDWADGEAYALLGASGCGKTTLLNIISGLVRPSRGRILFDGLDVTDEPTAARNIAQVFQFPVVYDTLSVRDNLAFPLRNRGLPAPQVAARVAEVAAMLGLTDTLDRRARGLTADAKQKISLGRGMVREDVRAILLDEPLTVIDPHMKWELRTQLKALQREFGHTMIYVTHDQTEALTFASQVVVMHEGRVVQVGTPQALFERPAHTFVGHFIGSPGMNVIPARVDGAQAVVGAIAAGVVTPALGGYAVPLARSYPPGEVEIGVRPEFARLSATDGLPITIRRVEDVGRHRIVRADLAGTAINVLADEDIGADMTRVVFDPAHVGVFQGGWRVEGSPA